MSLFTCRRIVGIFTDLDQSSIAFTILVNNTLFNIIYIMRIYIWWIFERESRQELANMLKN